MTGLLSKIKKLLRWVRSTKAGDDTGKYPVQQFEYMGKTIDAVVIYPYGHHANMPADVLAIAGAINGDSENRAVIGCLPPDRPQLAGGEVVLYHPDSGSKIHFKTDGSINVVGDLNVDNNLTVSGDLTVDGDITVPTGDVVAGTISLKLHVHPVTAAPGTTGIPTP